MCKSIYTRNAAPTQMQISKSGYIRNILQAQISKSGHTRNISQAQFQISKSGHTRNISQAQFQISKSGHTRNISQSQFLKSSYPRSTSRAQAQTQILNTASLHTMLSDFCGTNFTPVILCIGTDRLIGDSLGPLAGTLLEQKLEGMDPQPFHIYGTLNNTVHAVNLSEVYQTIKKRHPRCPVIAIDAAFGQKENIGSVFIHSGTLKPGSGVSKMLPAIGDISITGVVCGQSAHPYLDLQNIRLAFIMSMAESICDRITDAI